MAHKLRLLPLSKCEIGDKRCYITHRRAYLLLVRDFQELKRLNFKGITAFPVSEDMMEWEAEIEGLQNSIWHGLFFPLTINFTWAYNFVPPVVKFLTIPFHPNVDQHTGKPCIDFLDNPNKWSTSYTLSSILLTLQVMLSNPVLENPVNLEAAELLIKDKSLYNTAVLRLFKQPLPGKDDNTGLLKDTYAFTRPPLVHQLIYFCYHLLSNPIQHFIGPCIFVVLHKDFQCNKCHDKDANEVEHVTWEEETLIEYLENPKKSIKAIPFNDYYKTWSGIATSKATEYYRAPLLEDPNFVRSYYKWNKIDLRHPEEWRLKFAAPMAQLNRENNKPHRASHSTEGRYLYATPDPTSLGTPTETDFVTKIGVTEESWKNETSPEDDDTDSSWEEEVDDLVTWVNTLNTNILED
ncbi:ubiquitin-conjugating enzyme E2 U [Choloepus didactylus]|uniref:ubiquitin-conjugating enzyme E2 U n=1 Tax=Choloepus didactylus TaxID=27675 RepID=UPI00189D6380|nr:ubiquitin-conjugating enzyme E2 U [Choloepus didactylus]